LRCASTAAASAVDDPGYHVPATAAFLIVAIGMVNG
jgi:hypothetical protein